MSLHKLRALRVRVSALLRNQAKERLGNTDQFSKEHEPQEELEEDNNILEDVEEEEILETPGQITSWENHLMVFEAAIGAMDVLKVYLESGGKNFM